jgi:long-chain acyl-CoA synthetase
MPSTDISLRDDSGKEVGIGEPGELCVKGPQVMQGYWRNQAETDKVNEDHQPIITRLRAR